MGEKFCPDCMDIFVPLSNTVIWNLPTKDGGSVDR